MSNVLFLYERDMPTVSDLKGRFHDIFSDKNAEYKFVSVAKLTNSDLTWGDICFLIRPDNYISVKVAKEYKKTGKTVIYFMDDDLFNIPKKDLPTIPWKKKSLQKCLDNSDVFISSSKVLCDNYGGKCKRVYKIDSAINVDDFPKFVHRNNQDGVIKIVYAAGGGHEGVFNKYVKPSLGKLNEKYGSKISLNFVGVHPEIKENYDFDINYYGVLPLIEYRRFMKEKAFDIGLAPLNDDYFSSCKYFNKYIEYTTVGTVGIYSNVEPYKSVITNNYNGYLADNNDEAWFEAISNAIDNDNNHILSNAIDHIKGNFSSEIISKKIGSVVPELYYDHNEKKNKMCFFLIKLKYKFIRIFDKIYLACYYLKRDGVRAMFRKAKEHIKEGKVYK